jgi:hypothetical protein
VSEKGAKRKWNVFFFQDEQAEGEAQILQEVYNHDVREGR